MLIIKLNLMNIGCYLFSFSEVTRQKSYNARYILQNAIACTLMLPLPPFSSLPPVTNYPQHQH